jgi:hypothetical protein
MFPFKCRHLSRVYKPEGKEEKDRRGFSLLFYNKNKSFYIIILIYKSGKNLYFMVVIAAIHYYCYGNCISIVVLKSLELKESSF